jgi:hypothetical protein
LYNAIVYVPTEANANLSPFTQGVTCDQCATTISPAPLVKTTTDVYGRFTLTNVPAGKPFPVVIQLGRWRRKFTIPAVTACQTKSDTQLGQVLRMPKNQSEGDIPKTALVTGAVDTLECVLRNMGLDDSEFTGSNQTGRIHIYRGTNYGSQSPAKAAVGTTLEQSSLWTNPNLLKSYDLVFLSCEGSELDKSPWQDALLDYVNSGGRAYGTHFNYTWFWDKAPFSSTAQWNAWGETAGNVLANVDVSFQKGKDFAAWLSNVGALANNSLTAPQISLNVSRHNVDAPVGASTQQWVTVNPYPNTRKSTSLTAVQHLSFNTPLNKPADQQCGRVLFSDFHVRNANVNGASFPSECGARGPLTAQEKVLEFFFFDLAQCIEPPPAPPPPSCTPKTCAQLNATCGVQANGCGGTIDCGTCIAPATCGGGGVANQCGGTACTPINCQSQGIECGPAGDGCGKQIDCGSCPPPQTCGGSGQRGKCGGPSCLGKTCSQLGLNCGPAGDGCGNLIFCGECTKPGDSCGGGGSPGVCGQGTCKPKTCTELNANCGYVADGCGGVVNCGVCQNPGDVCGGAAGGQSNKCAPGSCTAKTCAQLNANCGLVGDGCGGQLNCGVCPLGQTCGGAGTPNQCGAPCTPKTCAQQNIECGPAGDGCGGVLNCGTCVEPDQCGGGGTPFKCGRPVVK